MKMLALVASLVCTSSLAAAEIEFLNMPLPAPYGQRVPVAELNDPQREAEARELRGMLERRIDPDVALAMVRLGLNLEGVATSLDLEEGLAFLDMRTKNERRR